MDVYSGYHQTFRDPKDAIKTVFTTGDAMYYYVSMLFSLKNVGASFERVMTRVFTNQIDRNLKAYVDDIVVKSMAFGLHVKHLEKKFANLQLRNMRLNLEKCVFGVGKVKFLEYQISRRGISTNPKKVDAILKLTIPWGLKDAQQLTKCLVALGKFISKLDDKCKPFFTQIKWRKTCT